MQWRNTPGHRREHADAQTVIHPLDWGCALPPVQPLEEQSSAVSLARLERRLMTFDHRLCRSSATVWLFQTTIMMTLVHDVRPHAPDTGPRLRHRGESMRKCTVRPERPFAEPSEPAGMMRHGVSRLATWTPPSRERMHVDTPAACVTGSTNRRS
jgi:hypothetical protein